MIAGKTFLMISTKQSQKRVKLQALSRGKEAVLLFLSAFYFLVATNTQSGWLFLLSSFLLGLMAICWLPPRRAAQNTVLQRELLGSPQRGVPLRVHLRLTNLGATTLREILVVEPANEWSRENAPFRWVVPRLGPGESAGMEYTLTPEHRGEHRLLGSQLTFGAPFGLFAVRLLTPDSHTFLVYPRLLSLPTHRQLTRLTGILTEFTSPRSKGDSRSLRSLREYRSGDDLRLVHWRSSAKSPRGVLMVREHHAPSRQLSLLLLDTSSRPKTPQGVESFEKAISLTASFLWSAHRAGTRCTLLLHEKGGWRRLSRWEEQFTELARVCLDDNLSFVDWLEIVSSSVGELQEARMGAHPVLVSSAESPEVLGSQNDWPQEFAKLLLVTPTEQTPSFQEYPVHLIDLASLDSSSEVRLHV